MKFHKSKVYKQNNLVCSTIIRKDWFFKTCFKIIFTKYQQLDKHIKLNAQALHNPANKIITTSTQLHWLSIIEPFQKIRLGTITFQIHDSQRPLKGYRFQSIFFLWKNCRDPISLYYLKLYKKNLLAVLRMMLCRKRAK